MAAHAAVESTLDDREARVVAGPRAQHSTTASFAVSGVYQRRRTNSEEQQRLRAVSERFSGLAPALSRHTAAGVHPSAVQAPMMSVHRPTLGKAPSEDIVILFIEISRARPYCPIRREEVCTHVLLFFLRRWWELTALWCAGHDAVLTRVRMSSSRVWSGLEDRTWMMEKRAPSFIVQDRGSRGPREQAMNVVSF